MSKFCMMIVFSREPQSSETGQTLSNQYVRTLSDKEKEQLMRMVQTPLSTDATDGGVWVIYYHFIHFISNIIFKLLHVISLVIIKKLLWKTCSGFTDTLVSFQTTLWRQSYLCNIYRHFHILFQLWIKESFFHIIVLKNAMLRHNSADAQPVCIHNKSKLTSLPLAEERYCIEVSSESKLECLFNGFFAMIKYFLFILM